MAALHVKICGLGTAETLEAALAAGADLVGFVHFQKSPRHVSLDLGARLSVQARGRAGRVLLLVDPDDALVTASVASVDPDIVQLHGGETPERVAAIRRVAKRPVMKALGVAGADDLAAVAAYRAVADHILLDAKPPEGADLPGGNGHAFDWDIVSGFALPDGTMLSGGLTPRNVGEAVRRTGIGAVDVSSGVESGPGLKDAGLIRAFVAAARAG